MADRFDPPVIGQRVRLREDFDCYPTGVFEKGMTGAVTHIDDQIIGVTLDQHREELNEWKNELHVHVDVATDNDWTLPEYFWRTWEEQNG